MEKWEVKAQLLRGNQILKEWRESHLSSLPGLINSMGHLKESLNAFLDGIQNKESPVAIIEKDELEFHTQKTEDEEKEDPLLKTIQELRNLKEQSELNKNKKEESGYLQEAKKMKT